MSNTIAIILAAGAGTRMKSKKSKVMHEVLGIPMVEIVCDEAGKAGIDETVVVVGHQGEQVEEYISEKANCVWQKEQLGTGHAVMQAKEYLEGKEGNVLVLCGDTPLITAGTLKQLIKTHDDAGNAATILTSIVDNATGYGRIIRNDDGGVIKIVEHKDCDEQQLLVNEINAGMYCFDIKSLLNSISQITNNNNQGEYYLTDTIEILISQGNSVGAFVCEDETETLGVNDRIQLNKAETILRERVNRYHMSQGVTIINPEDTYISLDVEIGMDTVILPGTMIGRGCKIGEDCTIGPNTKMDNSSVGNGTTIKQSVMVDAQVGNESTVGPFAYLRPKASVGNRVKVGDFVEIKNAVIGDKSAISHLTYVGDAEVGRNVNLGCGVVFVNYDGHVKNKTVVEDNAFVGCNTNLVSPVVVKKDSYIAAGSTITDEVPEYSLAIARQRQIVKENWVINKGKLRKEKP